MSQPDYNDTGQPGRFQAMRESGGYKSSTLIMSLLVLVLVIGGAVYVGFRSDDSDSTDTATAPATPSSSGAPSPQPTAPTTLPPGAFGIPSTDMHGTRIETPTNPLGQVLPQTDDGTPPAGEGPDAPAPPPAGLMWQRVANEPLPFSTSDGPTAITAAGVPTGFARTRQGAALAGWQIAWRAELAPDAQSRAVIADCAIVDVTSQPAVDKITNKGPDFAARARELPAGTFTAPIAVRVDNYDGSYAHVQFAVPTPADRGDAFIATAIYTDLVWQDGRWKWVVPADGVDPGQMVTTLDGFTPW